MAVNQGTISQQAYDYNIPPKNDVPFWGDEDINDNLTATATVDDTTGIPSVSVTKQNWNLDFAFKGIKGETGPQGEKGDPGEPGKSVKVTSTGSDVSGAVAGSVIDGDGKYITIYNGQQGAKGEQGERGPQGAPGIPGSDADVSKCVTGVSLTNENGIYGISETKGDGTTTDVGSIEVPNIDNTLAEVNDEIVENTAQGYDYHTIKETEHNGTVNNVGSFYLAKKQITSLDSKGNFTMVDQEGNESTGQLELTESSDPIDLGGYPKNITTDIDGNKIDLENSTYIIYAMAGTSWGVMTGAAIAHTYIYNDYNRAYIYPNILTISVENYYIDSFSNQKINVYFSADYYSITIEKVMLLGLRTDDIWDDGIKFVVKKVA